MKYNKYGTAAVLAAALLWSVDGLLRRHLYILPAPVIVFYEHLLGFIVLLPYILMSLKGFKALTRRQWIAIAGVSFLSGATATILYTAALGRIHYISFSVVVLLQQLNPVFAVATAAALLRERLTRRFIGLSIVALAGAYIVTFPHLSIDLSTGNGTLIAALFALGAAAGWGTSTAFSKYALEGTSSVHITAARYGITPFFALAYVFLSGSGHALGSVTLNEFLYLLAITFSTGLVALLIYYFGLKRVTATHSALLELAWPLSAVIIGWIFLHQGLTLTQGLGAIVLTGAIYLIAMDAQRTLDAAKSPKRQLKTKAAAS